MHILEYNNYQVEPTQEAFLIKPIRDLYNSDKTKSKDKFMTQMSIIYFLADPRSSYNYIIDEDERLKAIIEQEGLPEDFKISKKLQDAIDIYKKHVITHSYLLLEDTKLAIDKVRKHLRELDLDALDDKGRPKHTISNIISAIKQIPQLAKDVVEAEKIVTREIEEQGKLRGTANKTLMDDGILV